MARATRQPVKSRGATRAASNGTPVPLKDDPTPATPNQLPIEPALPTRPRRYRGTRGGRRHRHPEKGPAAEVVEQEVQPAFEPTPDETDGKPKRRRGSRGGRKHKKPAQKVAEAAAEKPATPAPAATTKRPRSRKPPAEAVAEPQPAGRTSRPPARRETPPAKPRPVAARKQKGPQRAITVAKPRIPVTGAPTENVPPPFAHNAEYEFARILDFYGIDWQYEPRTFPLRWERGHVTEAFTPDFYLTDLNLYVELTTLKSGLTAEKNRKMRLIKEMYPGTYIIMLKKQDYLRLLAKYGYGTLSPDEAPDIDRVLIPTARLHKRVAELGAQNSRDYAVKETVLVGVLRGVM